MIGVTPLTFWQSNCTYTWNTYYTSPFKWHSSTLMFGMICVGTRPASSTKKSAYARVPLVSLARSLGSIRPISLQCHNGLLTDYTLLLLLSSYKYLRCSAFEPHSHCQIVCPIWQFPDHWSWRMHAQGMRLFGSSLSQGSYPFSETNFQDFSRSQIAFSWALKFTLTPTLPRSQCYFSLRPCLQFMFFSWV